MQLKFRTIFVRTWKIFFQEFPLCLLTAILLGSLLFAQNQISLRSYSNSISFSVFTENIGSILFYTLLTCFFIAVFLKQRKLSFRQLPASSIFNTILWVGVLYCINFALYIRFVPTIDSLVSMYYPKWVTFIGYFIFLLVASRVFATGPLLLDGKASSLGKSIEKSWHLTRSVWLWYILYIIGFLLILIAISMVCIFMLSLLMLNMPMDPRRFGEILGAFFGGLIVIINTIFVLQFYFAISKETSS